MDITKVAMQTVRYKFDSCVISAPNLKESYTVPHSAIHNVLLDNDYENYFLPYFQLDLNLPSSVIRAMKKTPNEIKIDIQMTSLYYNQKDSEQMVPTSTVKFINARFVAYMEKPSRSIMDSTTEDVEESLGYGVKTVDPNSMEVTKVTLYEEKILEKMGKTVNYIVTSGNLPDMLTLVLNSAGINNVLLSPPNNYKRYREFKITPISAKRQIERLCNHYGIHTNGTLVYFGLERNYIIDKVPKCTAWVTNEYTITYLYYPGQGAEIGATSACCGKSASEKANYIYLTPSMVSFNDLSVPAGSEYSDSTVAMDSMEGGGGGSDYYVRDSGDNTAAALNRLTKSFGLTATATFRNVDLEMLTPNKCFNITVDDKKFKQYNANYMITKATTTFIKKGDMFDTVTMCSFRT